MDNTNDNNAAADLIRQKLTSLYAEEPDLKKEEAEVLAVGASSPYQRFAAELAASGKSFAEQQSAWHQYYGSLSDADKHAVWREFYENQSRSGHYMAHSQPAVSASPQPETPMAAPTPQIIAAINPSRPPMPMARLPKHPKFKPARHKTSAGRFLNAQPASPGNDKLTVAQLKHRIADKVSSEGRLKAKHHLKSLLFGLSIVSVFLLAFVFVMFNQLFIGPFITPSKLAGATPLITDPNNSNVGETSRVIIPKISVDAPLITDATDNQEKTIQAELENGVVLYPYTGKPGEKANPVIFGHSSNNLFNKGSYKFVFVSLNKLEINDTFMINYGGVQYVYKVFNKKIVKPSEVSVLEELPKPSMATLITCDPPGTNTNRLIVQGEQISPDPNANAVSSPTAPINTSEIPGSPDSLWSRIWNTIF